jgi:hypothetical protein
MMEKGYAQEFGFSQCTLAPFYKGIMPLRKCIEAVECSGKKTRDAEGYPRISMLYNFDYKSGDETGGSNLDCITHLDGGQFKINGKPTSVTVGDDSGSNNIVEFAAKGNAESTAKGCLVLMSK